MEKFILLLVFIVLPMILNALEQKKKREAARRMRERQPQQPQPQPQPRPSGGGEAKPRTLEEWIESMQRKAETRAERPPARQAPPPKPAPPPARRPPPSAPAPPPRAEGPERPQRTERPQVRETSARSRPSMTAAERSRKRSAKRSAERDARARDPIEVDARPGNRDSARRAVRARSAAREKDRRESLKARRHGKGGARIDIEGPDDLRRAFVLKEVLGQPRGLEDLPHQNVHRGTGS